MTPNQKAFLDTISFSEGTFGKGDDGYNVLVGGGLFQEYFDHPRKFITIHGGLVSSAAGRYQLLSRYFDAYKKLLNLSDFSPASQDAIALQQIKECRADQDVINGNFDPAIQKCAHIWASLPGAGYGQHENHLDNLRMFFQSHGGTINA